MAEEKVNPLAGVAQSVSSQTQAMFDKGSKYHDAYVTIDKIVAGFWERVPYLCIALVVFIIFWLLSKLFKTFIARALSNRSYAKQNLVIVLNRVGSTFIVFFGFLIALVIAIPGFSPGQLMSALGIGSVAIGFAFKDIFQNLLSGILILLGEPFRIGDSIICNGLEGTVEDIEIRATTLRSNDGRRFVIPNATVYTSSITVITAYTQRRCEVSIGIGYQDDIQKAKDLIIKLLADNTNVLNQPASIVNVSSLGDFSVKINVRWWVNTRQTSIDKSVSEIQELILESFNEHGISIPYPIQEQIMQAPPETAKTPS